jgi:GTP 3',8-cyclase
MCADKRRAEMKFHRLGFEKVYHHIDALHQYAKTGDTWPIHMIVGLTNLCNHNCIFCYAYNSISGKYNENDFVPAEKLISALREASEMGLRSVTLVGTGEPMLHREYVHIIRSMKEMGLDIGTFTNGALLDGDRANAVLDTHTFVRLSCSGSDQDEHNLIHHAGKSRNDFDDIVKKIQALLRRRDAAKKPTIGVQFCANQHNWMSIVKACSFWREIGVDYFSIKPVAKHPLIDEHEENVAPRDPVNELMREAVTMSNDNFAVYAKFEKFGQILTQEKDRCYNKCHGQAFSSYLDSDGKVYICGNMHSQEDFCVGNVFEEGSFKAVWGGERRKRQVEQIDVHSCPVGCKLDPLNTIVEKTLEPDPDDHPNFL